MLNLLKTNIHRHSVCLQILFVEFDDEVPSRPKILVGARGHLVWNHTPNPPGYTMNLFQLGNGILPTVALVSRKNVSQ